MSESTLFACACQIVAAMFRGEWFLSCGEKEVFGIPEHLVPCKNGLRIVMIDGNKVYWRMTGKDAKTVAHLVELFTESSTNTEFWPLNAIQFGDFIESGMFYRADRFDSVFYHDAIGPMTGHLINTHDGMFTIYRPDKLVETTVACFDKVIWIV